MSSDERDALDILQFFSFEHLPPHLRGTSAKFAELANGMIMNLPANPERTMALRKLLEAKDCAVRAILFARTPYERPGPIL